MIEQRSPEWYAARKGRVTGSMVGAILGLSPFQTRDDVLRSMVRAAHGAPSEFAGNAATQWGAAMEAQAIADFELTYGEAVAAMPFVPWEEWAGASPDGLCSDGKGLEVKCPYGLRAEERPQFKSLIDQPHYHAQMQWEMLACDWRAMWFVQWTPYDMHRTLVHRDDDWLNAHVPILRQFHAEYLDAVKVPEDHLAPMRAIIDTPTAAFMVAEWDQLCEAEERAKERKADLLAEMVAMAGRNALFAGRKLTLVEKEGAVSYAKALKALAPNADLEPYRGKASEHWRLS